MKKKNVFLAVLAVVLVLSASIGAAVAYFTTYAVAKGGYTIRISNRTEIHEETPQGQKIVTIKNTGKGTVFVRVTEFHGDDWVVTPILEGNDWEAVDVEGQTYWRYTKPLEPEEITSSLTFKITQANKDEKWQQGEERSIIVVYESVPALFTKDGLPDLDTAWNVGEVKIFEETVNPSPTITDPTGEEAQG